MIQTKGPLSSLAVVFHSMTEGTLLSPEGVKFFKFLTKNMLLHVLRVWKRFYQPPNKMAWNF